MQLVSPRSRIGGETVGDERVIEWSAVHATLVATCTGSWSPEHCIVATTNADMPTPSVGSDIDGAPGAPRECTDAFMQCLSNPISTMSEHLAEIYPDGTLASANPSTRHLAAFFRRNDFTSAVQRVSRGEDPTVVVSQMERSPWQSHHEVPASIKELDSATQHAIQQDIAVLELEAIHEARAANPAEWDAWLQTLGSGGTIEEKARLLARHLIQLGQQDVNIVFLQELRCKDFVLELVRQEFPDAQVYTQADETPLIPTVGIMTFERCDVTPIRVEEPLQNKIAMGIVQFEGFLPLAVGTCHGDANGLTAKAGELFRMCDMYGGDFQGGKEGADEETLQSQLPLTLSAPVPTRAAPTISPFGHNQGVKNRFKMFTQ